MDLLTFTDHGIYCPAGDFHIDPARPVPRALLTHGHSDHARPGMGSYLCTDIAAPVIRHRLGQVRLETIRYGETRQIGGARVSFHPAGHVPGSAQIRIAHQGQVWVVSGDYKTTADRLSTPFAPVRCHVFITECTFGLPVFHWPTEAELIRDLNIWWASNAAAGRPSVLGAYALGKAQRLLTMLDPRIGPILTHPAIEATNGVIRAQGIPLPATIQISSATTARTHPGAMIIAPPSAATGTDMAGFANPVSGFASGWMAVQRFRRRGGAGRGFVISDHADWPGLNDAIRATGAARIFVTHGYTGIFRRWLDSQGYDAQIVGPNLSEASADSPDSTL